MGFLDSIRARLLSTAIERGSEENNPDLGMLKNLQPNDFIIIDGKSVSIYNEDISVEDIVDFFRARLPFIKVSFNDNVKAFVQDPIENLSLKHMVYVQLTHTLVEFHKAFDEACMRTNEVVNRSMQDDSEETRH